MRKFCNPSFRVALHTAVLAWAGSLVVVATPSHSACLPSGTDAHIQAALNGPNAVAELCPGAVFDLFNTVDMNAHGQQIRTQGLPTGSTRATLRIASASIATAIKARNVDNINIRNIRVNGRRGLYGHMPNAQALLMLGGDASGQTVRNVEAKNTRSWSTIHVFEGPSFSRCINATISNNQIGPAGTDQTNKWADGISLACKNSLVSGNTITDATDGAIVVFGAPGSVVEFNTIRQTGPTLLGGINMVDYIPFDGNYNGTVVRNNTIRSEGGFIKTGIAMGPRVWFCPGSGIPQTGPSGVVFGGKVTNNVLQGSPFGYGYVVDGVSNWTVTGNSSTANHVGKPSLTCEGDQKNTSPEPFVKHPAHAQGTFQVNFASLGPEIAHRAIGVIIVTLPF